MSKSNFNCVILLATFFGLSAFSQHESTRTPSESPTFTQEQFIELIKQKQIKTVDELLRHIPPLILSNPILVHSTHALNADRVSFSAPRVILFNEDLSLIFSFTQYPGKKLIEEGLDGVEILTFDKTRKTFQIFDIVLDGKSVPFSHFVPESNPTRCTVCHGNNPRPLMQTYSTWPGFYGSFSIRGYSVNGSLEHSELKSFLQNASSLERYKTLNFSKFFEVQEDIEKNVAGGIRQESNGLAKFSRFDSDRFSPLFLFGGTLQERMNQRLAKKIVSHPKFSEFRQLFAFLGAPNSMFNCGPVRERMNRGIEILNRRYATQIAEIRTRLISMLLQERKEKYLEFLKFNLLNPMVDPRGPVDVVGVMSLTSDQNFNSLMNPQAFYNQLLLLEIIFSDLEGFDNSDINTDHRSRSLGFLNPLFGDLYRDEQFFQQIGARISELDPDTQDIFAKGFCRGINDQTVEVLSKRNFRQLDGKLRIFEFGNLK